MTARDEVLARIRSALGGTTAGDTTVTRDYATGGRRPPGALLDLLVERLVDYGADVRHATPDQVPTAVAAAVVDGLARRPDGPRPRIVVPVGLDRRWVAAVEGDVVSDEALTVDDLDGCAGAVTAAATAIAQTGTIVLDGAPDQGRRALTLVPDLHVCVVDAARVVETVPEAVARLDPTRPLTWISGPSATSDIELERVEGVHGPRTLQVVLRHIGT